MKIDVQNKRLTLIIQSPGKVGSYKFSETECSSEFVWTRDDVYCEDGTIADVFCESERRDAERDEKLSCLCRVWASLRVLSIPWGNERGPFLRRTLYKNLARIVKTITYGMVSITY